MVPSLFRQSAPNKPVVCSNLPLDASFGRKIAKAQHGNFMINEYRKSSGLDGRTPLCASRWRLRCTLSNDNSIGEEVTCRDKIVESGGTAAEEKGTSIVDDDLMTVYFVDSDVIANAAPGTMLYEVAEQNGVEGISIGCGQGSCGICEVEVKKFSRDVGEDETEVPGIVVRSCVTPVPRGDYRRIQVSEMLEDPIWGTDGFDT